MQLLPVGAAVGNRSTREKRPNDTGQLASFLVNLDLSRPKLGYGVTTLFDIFEARFFVGSSGVEKVLAARF